MKGSDLKEILRREGVVFNQLAEALEMSQQNLSAAFTRDDVKSGLLEKVAKYLNKPVGYFYGENQGPVQTAVGDNNTQVGGDYQISDAGVLELLKMKDEQLLLTIRQVSKAQEQMDRILDRICEPEKAREFPMRLSLNPEESESACEDKGDHLSGCYYSYMTPFSQGVPNRQPKK